MYSSPVRHSPPVRASSYCAAVRLACVRPTASVHSEPGSNSSLKITGPKANTFSCRSSTQLRIACYKAFDLLLLKRLQDGQSSFLQASAQVTCAHCQRSWESASAPSSVSRRFRRGEPHILAARFGSVNTASRYFHLPLDLAANRFRRGEPYILAARSGSVNTVLRCLHLPLGFSGEPLRSR